MKVRHLVAAVGLVSPGLVAQSPQHPPPVSPPPSGSITGHVTLGDSRLPARMATVYVVPVKSAEANQGDQTFSFVQAQTGLDGTFAIPSLIPGDYFVVASKPGYALPAPDSGCYEDYEVAPQNAKSAIAAKFPHLTVGANQTSSAEIVLRKGAAISGSVLFDDGAPVSGSVVSLLRKESSGKWTTCDMPSFSSTTDDLGSFRLSGLPPGEYLLRTTLALHGNRVSSAGPKDGADPDYRWDVYFGDGVRPKDAKTIHVKDGEESDGNALRIPLAMLHPVLGVVLNSETGAPIHEATVELHNADDDATDTETHVDSDGRFRFPYVAEGEYTIKITNASDPAPGAQPRKDKPAVTYEDASQPLILRNETDGVTIQVKPKPTTTD